jgi:hypothetical protein
MFPHCNVHKYTGISPDGKTHKEIEHILIDERWHSNVVDTWCFRRTDYDTIIWWLQKLDRDCQ